MGRIKAYTKQDGDRYTDQPHKKVNSSPTRSLKAFSVDNSRTGIIILVLGDPHLLECGKGRKNFSIKVKMVIQISGVTIEASYIGARLT